MDRDSTSPTQSMTDPTATAEPSLKRAHHDDDHQSPVPSSSHLEAASSSANMLSSEKGAQKRPRLPISTQVTKSDLPSPDANEVTILPGLVLPLNEEVLRTFFQYSHDRHDVFLKRKQGKPQEEWTDDPVFKSTKFANVYRVLDRLTQYVLTRVVQDGPQQLEEVCFRVLLFRSFARISTYEVIRTALGGPPTLASFSPTAYENFLMPHISAGNPVYGSSYFIPAPREFRTKYPYQSTLRLVHLMMRTGLPRRLADLHHMRDAHALLTSFPSLGPFLAMQLLLDLNLSDHFDFSEEEFAACGPGSKQCLVDIFGKYVSGFELEAMRWIQKEQEHYWGKYGITDVPHLCPARKPGLNVVDIEHTLCEVFKYRRARGRMEAPARNVRGSKRGRRGRGAARATPAAASPARGIKQEDEDGLDGLDFERIRSNGSKTSGQEKVKSFVPTGNAVTGELPAKWLVPRAPEEYERPPPLDRSEDVYEVSHIVAMTPTQSKCLVRWKGFGPDDDTWEYFDELLNGGAKEAVEEYLKWLRTVKDEIEAMLDEEKSNREALEKMPAVNMVSSVIKASPEPHGLGTRPALPFANMPLALPF